MSSTVCPVVSAIAEIRGAGLDDADGDSSRAIKVGGHMRVVDEVAFLINAAKLDLARFELSSPGPAALLAYATGRSWMRATDTRSVYERVLHATVGKSGLLDQLDAVISALTTLGNMIVLRAERLGAEGKPVDISMADLPLIDRAVLYRPDLLAQTTREIVRWVDQLSGVVAVPRAQSHTSLDPIPTIPAAEKIGAVRAPVTIAGLRTRLDAELAVYAQVRVIEEFHCRVISALEEVIDRINAAL